MFTPVFPRQKVFTNSVLNIGALNQVKKKQKNKKKLCRSCFWLFFGTFGKTQSTMDLGLLTNSWAMWLKTNETYLSKCIRSTCQQMTKVF